MKYFVIMHQKMTTIVSLAEDDGLDIRGRGSAHSIMVTNGAHFFPFYDINHQYLPRRDVFFSWVSKRHFVTSCFPACRESPGQRSARLGPAHPGQKATPETKNWPMHFDYYELQFTMLFSDDLHVPKSHVRGCNQITCKRGLHRSEGQEDQG